MTNRSAQRARARAWVAGGLVLALAALLFGFWRAQPAPASPAEPSTRAVEVANVPVIGPRDGAEPDSALLVAPPTYALTPGGSPSLSAAQLRLAAAAVPPDAEAPEVVAADSRGLHFIWPAWGPISTIFHEAGPYWVGGYHQGLDIAAYWGDPVRAAFDGLVVEAAEGWNKGYGNMVLIDHYNGFVTRYGHLDSILVKPGDEVTSGQLIGIVGSTGASEGPHLHFEVIVDGQLRDPLPYLPEHVERPRPTAGSAKLRPPE